MAYHGYELVYTLAFQRGRRDFPEYILHHLVTILLISFSYTLNHMRIGAVIMLIHDFTDVIISIFKCAIDTMSTPIQVLVYIVNVSAWVFYRNYFFTFKVIYPYYQQTKDSPNLM